MSRTVRRKYNKRNRSFWDKPHAVSEYVERVSKYGGVYRTYVKMEGQALKKAAARYHSDSRRGWSAGVWERTTQHAKHRARVNTEFARYFKDAEYEVMIQANPRWPYWD